MKPLHPVLRQSLFIAGTDTGVGKTWVACRVLQALAGAGYRVAGMKPVAAGAEMTSHGARNDDALALATAASVDLPYQLVNPCCFMAATAPHLAAETEAKSIDLGSIKSAFEAIRQKSELIIVEGAGGWLTPIGNPDPTSPIGPTMQDVAQLLGLPVLLVVGMRLGSINHSLLTAAAIRGAGLELAGWVANPIDPAFEALDGYTRSLAARLGAPLVML